MVTMEVGTRVQVVNPDIIYRGDTGVVVGRLDGRVRDIEVKLDTVEGEATFGFEEWELAVIGS